MNLSDSAMPDNGARRGSLTLLGRYTTCTYVVPNLTIEKFGTGAKPQLDEKLYHQQVKVKKLSTKRHMPFSNENFVKAFVLISNYLCNWCIRRISGFLPR
jgi:hypothetical protein